MYRLIYLGDIMERARAYVQPSDLPIALKSFKEKTGADATQVEVCSKVASVLENVVPEGIEIINGLCTWEIWLGSSKWDGEAPVKTPGPALEHTLQKVSQVTRLVKDNGRETLPPAVKKSLQRVKKAVSAIKPGKGDVSKLLDVAKVGAKVGRPRKEGDAVSHWTDWRRRKRLQGVLSL